jgi:hypothetical protein
MTGVGTNQPYNWHDDTLKKQCVFVSSKKFLLFVNLYVESLTN